MLKEYTKQPGGFLVSPWNIFERDARIVRLFGPILSYASMGPGQFPPDSLPFTAEDVIASLIILAEDSKEPVSLVISSLGGCIESGLSIIGAIEQLQAQGITVRTLVLVRAMSMAGVTLAMGTKGHRYALPRTYINLHAGTQTLGTANPDDMKRIQTYLEVRRTEMLTLLGEKTKLPELYLESTKLKLEGVDDINNQERRTELVRQLTEREQFFTPQQAIAAGIIDHVIEPGDGKLSEIFHLNK